MTGNSTNSTQPVHHHPIVFSLLYAQNDINVTKWHKLSQNWHKMTDTMVHNATRFQMSQNAVFFPRELSAKNTKRGVNR